MFGFRYFKSRPTDYVVLFRGGRARRQALGLSGFVFMPTTTAAAVPTDARDEIFAVEALTADYQTLTVQGLLTYRMADAALAAVRQDFSIDLLTRRHTGEPMKQIVERLRAIVQTACREALVRSTLDAALNKADELSRAIIGTIAADKNLTADGIAVDRVLVLSVRPAPEIRKALEATLREQLLRQADAAVFDRRRSALNDEHDIKLRDEKNKRELEEKELANQQALEAERKKLADARAVTSRAEAEAEAAALRERLKPWAEISPQHISAMAMKDWANKNEGLASLALGGDALDRLADAMTVAGKAKG